MSIEWNVIFYERFKILSVIWHELHNVASMLEMTSTVTLELVAQSTEKTIPEQNEKLQTQLGTSVGKTSKQVTRHSQCFTTLHVRSVKSTVLVGILTNRRCSAGMH